MRRLRAVNRLLIVAMLVLTLVFAELASHAFHGHKRRVTLVRATASERQSTRQLGASGARHHHHDRGRRLRPAAQAPKRASAAPTTTASAPPAASAPTVVSGGS